MAEAYLFAKIFSPNTFYSANSPNINPTKYSRYTVAKKAYNYVVVLIIIIMLLIMG